MRRRLAQAVLAVLVAGILVPMDAPVPAAAAPAPPGTIVLSADGPSSDYMTLNTVDVHGRESGGDVAWQNRSGRPLRVTDDVGLLDSGVIPHGGSFHADLSLAGTYRWSTEIGDGVVVVRPQFTTPQGNALDSLPPAAFQVGS